MKTLNLKWKDFQLYEKIYTYFKPLWIVLSDNIKKEGKEKDNIYNFKKYIEKKNSFINELELLFYSFNDIHEFKKPLLSRIYVNKGIKAIYMIFHFFILLFNFGGDETDINNIYNDFHLFISLLIIGSSNVKWPNESEYREV